MNSVNSGIYRDRLDPEIPWNARNQDASREPNGKRQTMNRMPWWAVAVAMCASIVAGRDHVEEMPLSHERAEMARVFARAWTSENNSVGIYSGPTLDDIDYNYGGKNFPDVLEMNQRGYEPMLLRTRLKGNPPELFYYNSVELRGQTRMLIR